MKQQTNYNPFQNFISFSKEMGCLLCKLQNTSLKYVFSEVKRNKHLEICIGKKKKRKQFKICILL